MRPSRRPDRLPQTCTLARETLSARHDGEALPRGASAAGLRRHLEGCPACSRFASRLTLLSEQVSEQLAVTTASVDLDPGPRGAGGGPALTSSILTTMALHDPVRRSALSPVQLRVLVAVAGLAQLVLALPVLVGAVGPGLHAGRELGSLQLAIGAGLLVAALQPLRAAGVLPVVAVVTALTVVIAIVDVASGAATVVGELVHVSELIGLAALWALARRTPLAAPTPPRKATAS